MQKHKFNLVHIFLSITFSAFLFLYSTISSAFCTKTYEADFNVTLNDSRIIKVTRKVCWTFQFLGGDSGSPVFMESWPDKYWIKFKHPDTHEKIEWEGGQYFDPLLLDFVKGVPYLVVGGRPDKDTSSIYGCPELPFIFLKYEKTGLWGKWIPIPVEQAPTELKYVNLPGNERIQGIIPRSYDEWDYAYKNNYLNERRQNDCRPPRTQLPPVILPAATEVTPEVLETLNYTPDRLSSGDDWGRLTFDQKREGECKRLFRSADPNDYMQDQRFINDDTGNKRVPYSRNGQFQMGTRVLCDDKYVWFVSHLEEPGKMLITKYTISGDLVLRVSFLKPELLQGYVGYISIPSLRSGDDYLYFDWMDFRDVNREWHIKRILKMRTQIPLPKPVHEIPASMPIMVAPSSPTGAPLTGSWSIDTKATESFVKNSPPPPLDVRWLAKWFTSSAKSLAVRTYEFKGDTVIASENSAARKLEFQLTSQQGTEIQYSLKTVSNGPAKRFKVSLLKDGNIIIVPSGEPEMAYVVWKRGPSKQEQSTSDEVMNAWVASIKDIVLFLFGLPKGSLEPPAPIEKDSPLSDLEAAIRIGAIRRATSIDAHAWLNANTEKYKRKNLSPPDDLDEAYTLGYWIYRANAYVVLKQFTYPPNLNGVYVPIFMIPRDIPTPDGNYGNSKIYYFYDNYFEGPSVEYTLGSPWANGSGFIFQSQ